MRMQDIYPLAGITKQGFHQALNREIRIIEEQEHLLPQVKRLRTKHKKLACRKMYKMIKPTTMGRDRFEQYCFSHGYRVVYTKSWYVKTTDSTGVIRFENLILLMDQLTGVNQLWVSDITYYHLAGKAYYITLILDIYNREIVGYSLSNSLSTESTSLAAIKMAVKYRKLPKGDSSIVFHTDGGGQYYASVFIKFTSEYGFKNSMCYTPYENPHAERINGTIKNDYLYPNNPKDYTDLQKLLTKSVNLYNRERPHDSLGKISPTEFLKMVSDGLLTKIWVINKKKKVTKKEKVNININ